MVRIQSLLLPAPPPRPPPLVNTRACNNPSSHCHTLYPSLPTHPITTTHRTNEADFGVALHLLVQALAQGLPHHHLLLGRLGTQGPTCHGSERLISAPRAACRACDHFANRIHAPRKTWRRATWTPGTRDPAGAGRGETPETGLVTVLSALCIAPVAVV